MGESEVGVVIGQRGGLARIGKRMKVDMGRQ